MPIDRKPVPFARVPLDVVLRRRVEKEFPRIGIFLPEWEWAIGTGVLLFQARLR